MAGVYRLLADEIAVFLQGDVSAAERSPDAAICKRAELLLDVSIDELPVSRHKMRSIC